MKYLTIIIVMGVCLFAACEKEEFPPKAEPTLMVEGPVFEVTTVEPLDNIQFSPVRISFRCLLAEQRIARNEPVGAVIMNSSVRNFIISGTRDFFVLTLERNREFCFTLTYTEGGLNRTEPEEFCITF